MVYWVRARLAHGEDLNVDPSAHLWWLTTACNCYHLKRHGGLKAGPTRDCGSPQPLVGGDICLSRRKRG